MDWLDLIAKFGTKNECLCSSVTQYLDVLLNRITGIQGNIDQTGLPEADEEFEALKSELLEDSFLREWMSEQEITDLLEMHYLTQQEGRRKQVNIKARIVFARLFELLYGTQH